MKKRGELQLCTIQPCLNGFRRLPATLQQIFVHLRLLGVRLRDPTEWGTVSSPYISAYALYISCVSPCLYAGRSPSGYFATTHQAVLSALAQSEDICNRVWPTNVTDLIRINWISICSCWSVLLDIWPMPTFIDDFLLGLVIVQSFHELKEYAEINDCFMSVAKESHRATHGLSISVDYGLIYWFIFSIQAVRSLIHKSLSNLEVVWGIFLSPCLQHSFCRPPNFRQGLFAKVEDGYNLSEKIQKLVDLWIDGSPFLHKSAGTTEHSRFM